MAAGRGLAAARRGMEDGRRRPGAGRRDGGRSPAASPSPPPDPAGGEAAGWVAGRRRDGRPAVRHIIILPQKMCPQSRDGFVACQILPHYN
uniref:Transposon protein, putative, CACTA, En/Spm sub-class n=2 Tax=Oryza sativa subsp. japonica TaxID=39947 RepID=Q9AYH2_ORYSJ|nr:Hypothetical protein [Oryza sativa]AAP52044.1 transposon protein, putative, CACTA, En/Spm sub-class [Oryza sativa Japonica Group]